MLLHIVPDAWSSLCKIYATAHGPTQTTPNLQALDHNSKPAMRNCSPAYAWQRHLIGQLSCKTSTVNITGSQMKLYTYHPKASGQLVFGTKLYPIVNIDNIRTKSYKTFRTGSANCAWLSKMTLIAWSQQSCGCSTCVLIVASLTSERVTHWVKMLCTAHWMSRCSECEHPQFAQPH